MEHSKLKVIGFCLSILLLYSFNWTWIVFNY